MEDIFDVFELKESPASFVDARLIQYVSDPARLRWDGPGGPGGGFFIEADQSPTEGFVSATLLTRDGRKVPGFAARRIRIFPVALRSRWEIGEPGAWRVVPDYQPGARSRTQVLALLPEGAWVVLTARGLASKALARAFRDHARWVAIRFRSASGRPCAPFAAALILEARNPHRAGSSVITPLERVIPERPERAPVALGQQVQKRWAEIQAWQAEWAGGHPIAPPEEANPSPSPAPEAPPAGNGDVRPAAAPKSSLEPGEAIPPPASAPGGPPGPEPDLEAGLAFLLGQAWPLARPRLARAFPELATAASAAEAVTALARQAPGAAFWGRIGQALDRFLAWADRVAELQRIDPARVQALKEAIRVGPAWGQDIDDPQALAAMAALTWLFRPGDREGLDRIMA